MLPVESPALSAGPLGATCRTNTVSMGSAFCLSMSSTWWSRPFIPGPGPGFREKKGYNINHTMTKGGICLWFAVWILPVVKQLMGCNWWKLIFSNILKWSSFACNLQSRKSRLMESWVLVDVSHLHLHSSVNEIPTIFTSCFQSLWFRIVNYKVNMFSQSTYTCLIPYHAPQDT